MEKETNKESKIKLEKNIVNPWEVRGNVDYGKLIKEFGTQPITLRLKSRIFNDAKSDNVMLRRDFFFSQRDLDEVLQDHKKGKKFFLYTGRGPSGPMHIGHIIPFMFTKWLQDKFDVNLYIQITDDEKQFVKRDKTPEEISKWTEENIKDIAALGFNPDKTFIFKDTEYIKQVYPLLINISKKITFSTTRAVFGFTNETNIGLIFYPAYQIAPTLFERDKRALIPSAIDQDPYWRIQRDIAEKLGGKKAAAIHSKFIPSLAGVDGKMSSSDPNGAIWLTDDEKTVRKKIMKYAFSGGRSTIEEHRKLGGNPDVDVSFQWLKIFFEPDDKKLKEIESEYKSGKLLTGELKQIVVDKINKFLKEHRKKKENVNKNIEKYMYSGMLAKKMWKLNHN